MDEWAFLAAGYAIGLCPARSASSASDRLSDEDPTVILDREIGSRWSLAHGEALDGPMKGTRLARASAYPAFWFGWQGYFPLTEIWKKPQ